MTDRPVPGGAKISSIVLGSTMPERLAAWYRGAFAPHSEVRDSVLEMDGGFFVFDRRDDIADRAAEPGRTIVNIQTARIDELVDHLSSLSEVAWVRRVEDIPIGKIATVEDIDGNLVNIIEFRQSS